MAVKALQENVLDFLLKPVNSESLLGLVARAYAQYYDVDWDFVGEDLEYIEDSLSRITDREREVLDMLVDGNSSREIGKRLGVSTKTIEAHRARINDKMRSDDLVLDALEPGQLVEVSYDDSLDIATVLNATQGQPKPEAPTDEFEVLLGEEGLDGIIPGAIHSPSSHAAKQAKFGALLGGCPVKLISTESPTGGCRNVLRRHSLRFGRVPADAANDPPSVAASIWTSRTEGYAHLPPLSGRDQLLIPTGMNPTERMKRKWGRCPHDSEFSLIHADPKHSSFVPGQLDASRNGGQGLTPESTVAGSFWSLV